MQQGLLTEKQTCELLNVSAKTLQSWRFLNKNLPYLKVGRSIRYAKEDIERYLENSRIQIRG